MAPIALVVTDLDGTFWHTDDHVPDAVLDAVHALERRGVPLLVATGRRLASTAGPLARFGLTPPAIVLNGALGVDIATGDRFHRAPFPHGAATSALDAFAAVGLSPVVYVDHPDHDVLLGPAPDTHPTHAAALADRAQVFGSDTQLRAATVGAAVLGFSMIGVPWDRAEAAAAALTGVAEVHLDRSLDHPGTASFTVAPRGQSKWDGVLAFCRLADLDSSRVLVLADGPNDLELLAAAAVRLVPRVAHESALALATTVIPSAAEGGWAHVLDHV